ncbi:hypothetical protein SAMN05444486_10619 [Lentibacter algarum]|uniref:Uncharacterized protein n=1 Tax=Lentibacter algarum TaxID=576131 RepID=A0A1H3NAL2_9RHOB|nr:hypothetical protein SAMN05444486_10619 [Lentibacter algarum]
MPVSGFVRAMLAGLVVSGCATSGKQCEKPDRTSLSYGDVTMFAPEGCWFTDEGNSPVRSIACSDGRQGLAIADVSDVSVEADE